MALILDNSTADEYIRQFETIGSKNTAHVYQNRLSFFRQFVSETYNLTLDELIMTLTTHSHDPKIDVYNLLSKYVSYIQTNKSISPVTVKLLLSTARSYLETFNVEISPRRYQLKVKTPRVVRSEKEALTKEDIRIILDACSHSLKLKTYILFLAATGCRATEALSIRLCDVHFNKDTAVIFLRGEYTKTKTDRWIMLTDELVNQLKLWLEYKYRTRRIHYYDKKTGKSTNEIRTPTKNKELYIFSSNYEKNPSLEGLYINMASEFEHTLDRLGGKFAEFENAYKRRRKITLHSFRRFVKTTIADLGYSEYSEAYIGHSGSTYYRKPEKEKIIMFRKVEPYLTFMDQTSLERKGADLSNRLETMEQENRELRDNINKIMEMIQQNLKLAQVKPEALTKKIR